MVLGVLEGPSLRWLLLVPETLLPGALGDGHPGPAKAWDGSAWAPASGFKSVSVAVRPQANYSTPPSQPCLTGQGFGAGLPHRPECSTDTLGETKGPGKLQGSQRACPAMFTTCLMGRPEDRDPKGLPCWPSVGGQDAAETCSWQHTPASRVFRLRPLGGPCHGPPQPHQLCKHQSPEVTRILTGKPRSLEMEPGVSSNSKGL